MSEGLAGGFTWIDWSVVAAVLLITTVVGERLSGKQQSIRDFFLGGRRLPWYAVSASIVATEISAVTYVSLPAVVYKDGGNLTYLQLGLIGSFVARGIVGYVLVPAYYAREIYSPYDYVGNRLGPSFKSATTAIFSFGGVLAQASRVYLIAVVLEVILYRELGWVEAHWGIDPLVAAVAVIGVVAVIWTLIGGIATVVWTDAILFCLFLVGVAIVLVTVGSALDGGWPPAVESAYAAGKFRLLDFDTSPAKAYTFWAALFAASWSGVGSYGTDQLLTQRLFCCRSAREARKALLGSYAAMLVTVLVSAVGIGLFAYYREFPLTGAALELVDEKADRIFPVFIVEAIPTGWKGLVIAGAFAAAISSLDSILAALSQTTLSAVVLPWRERRRRARGSAPPAETDEAEARWALRASRLLVVFWALLLCSVAVSMELVERRYDSILDLALAMAGYTGGALLAGFLLAFLPLRIDGRGYFWSAPLSVLAVFALVWHQSWAQAITLGLAGAVFVAWVVVRAMFRAPGDLARTAWLVALLAAIVVASLYAYAVVPSSNEALVLAFPWYMPVGSLVAFVFGWLLSRPRSEACA